MSRNVAPPLLRRRVLPRLYILFAMAAAALHSGPDSRESALRLEFPIPCSGLLQGTAKLPTSPSAVDCVSAPQLRRVVNDHGAAGPEARAVGRVTGPPTNFANSCNGGPFHGIHGHPQLEIAGFARIDKRSSAKPFGIERSSAAHRYPDLDIASGRVSNWLRVLFQKALTRACTKVGTSFSERR